LPCANYSDNGSAPDGTADVLSTGTGSTISLPQLTTIDGTLTDAK